MKLFITDWDPLIKVNIHHHPSRAKTYVTCRHNYSNSTVHQPPSLHTACAGDGSIRVVHMACGEL